MSSYHTGMIMGAALMLLVMFTAFIAAFGWLIWKSEEFNPPPLEEDWGKDLGVVRSVFRDADGLLYERFTSTFDQEISTTTRLLRDQDSDV